MNVELAAETTAAVVVNHDAGDALLRCVASLREAGVDEVIVVDNASSDGSIARLAAADRECVLVPTGRNLGYGAGANRGVRRTRAEFVLICNPDLLVDQEAPGVLLSALTADSGLGAVGPLILRPDGTAFPSARAFPSLLTAAGHAFVGLFRTDNPFTRRYHLGESPEAPRDPDWLSGACLLVRRTAFDSVGGFDEAYFMYVEDLDFCWRLRRAGWQVRYVPEARVVHLQGGSSSRHPYRLLVAHHLSTWRFVVRSSEGANRALLVVIGPALAARCLLALLRELLKRRL